MGWKIGRIRRGSPRRFESRLRGCPTSATSRDFDALAAEPDVEVRYVGAPGELRGAAAIVLPGTKSTMADLLWLRRSGLADAILAAAAAGTPVLGICGGYQMLGRRVLDPDGIEGGEREVAGLGLLDVETTFVAEKRTVRVDGELFVAGILGAAGTPVRGYEIHMGQTTLGDGAAPAVRLLGFDGDVHVDGAVPVRRRAPLRGCLPAAGGGPVVGSYIGLFDEPGLRDAFLNGLRVRLGLAERVGPTSRESESVDSFADHAEAHLDLERLRGMTGLRL